VDHRDQAAARYPGDIDRVGVAKKSVDAEDERGSGHAREPSTITGRVRHGRGIPEEPIPGTRQAGQRSALGPGSGIGYKGMDAFNLAEYLRTALATRGVISMPEEALEDLALRTYMHLEEVVGSRLTDQLDNDQLARFGVFVDAGDDTSMQEFLKTELPQYPGIIEEETGRVIADAADWCARTLTDPVTDPLTNPVRDRLSR
jgi:hypothetical protein